MALDFKDMMADGGGKSRKGEIEYSRVGGFTKFGQIRTKAAQTAEQFEEDAAHPVSAWVAFGVVAAMTFYSIGAATNAMFGENELVGGGKADPTPLVLVGVAWSVLYAVATIGVYAYRRWAVGLVVALYAVEWVLRLTIGGASSTRLDGTVVEPSTWELALHNVLVIHPAAEMVGIDESTGAVTAFFGLLELGNDQLVLGTQIAVGAEQLLFVLMVFLCWGRFARAGQST